METHNQYELILTKERFEDILKKPEIATRLRDYYNENFSDLYDILYNMDSDHNFGVITVLRNDEYSAFKSIFGETELSSYKYGEIGINRSFINDLKRGMFREIIEDYWENFVQNEYPSIKYNTVDEYINSLITFEKKYQDYIIENTSENVRKEIKEYQIDMADDIESALYDDEQIEFLQILHDGIKKSQLSIFDPVDCDFIMGKLLI